LPCIHVVRVLNWREEFWRVWEYTGKEYSIGCVEKTCGLLTEIDYQFLVWLHNLTSEQLKGDRVMSRSFRAGNGHNTARIPSIGEQTVIHDGSTNT